MRENSVARVVKLLLWKYIKKTFIEKSRLKAVSISNSCYGYDGALIKISVELLNVIKNELKKNVTNTIYAQTRQGKFIYIAHVIN